MTTFRSKKRFANIGIKNPFGIINLNNEIVDVNKGAYKARCSKCGNFMQVFKDSFAGKRIRLSLEMFKRSKFECKKCGHENYLTE